MLGLLMATVIIISSLLCQLSRAYLDHQLIEAVIRRDEKAVVSALRLGANANARTSPDFVQRCLNYLWHGQRGERGDSALHCAVTRSFSGSPSQEPSIVEDLVKNGADVNEVVGDCPLIVEAAECCPVSVVRALLRGHPDVNAETRREDTALEATLHRTPDWQGLDAPAIISLLIEAKADIGARDSSGYTVIDYARGVRYSPAVRRSILIALGQNGNSP